MSFNISGFSAEEKKWIKDLGFDPNVDYNNNDISLDDLKKAKEKMKEKFEEAAGKLFVKLDEKNGGATYTFLSELSETSDEVAQEAVYGAKKGFKVKELEQTGIKIDNQEIKNITVDLLMGKIDEDGYNKLKNFLNEKIGVKILFNIIASKYADYLFNWLSSTIGDGLDNGLDGEVIENMKKIRKEKDRLIGAGNSLDALVLMITARDYVPDANDSLIGKFKRDLENIMAGKTSQTPPRQKTAPGQADEERPSGANPDQFEPDLEKDINAVFGVFKGKNVGVETSATKLFSKQLITAAEYSALKTFADSNASVKRGLNKAAWAYADYYLKKLGSSEAPVSAEIKANLNKIADAMNKLGKNGKSLDALVLVITAMNYPAGKDVLIPEFEKILNDIVKSR